MLSLAFPTPSLPISKSNIFAIKYNPISSIPKVGACLISSSERNKPNFTSTLTSVSLPKFHKLLARAEEYEDEGKEDEMVNEDQPHLPKHVAIFTDGHRRWAKARGLPKEEGYRTFTKSVMEYALVCYKMGIKVLTVLTLASVHFISRKESIEGVFTEMFEEGTSYLDLCNGLGIRISVIGNRSILLPESMRELITKVEKATMKNSRLHLLLAIDYNGQSDIIQACTSVASQVKDGLIQLEDINENLFEQQLQTNCSEFPNPDLLIRTGGDIRLSNFMLWQLAYTELYFVDKLSPDFHEADFMEALSSFQKRRRRYGGTKY